MAEDAVCPVTNCELPVDIVLKSSDGCLVGAHHDNLAHFSEAFPTPGSVKTTGTPVDLPEDGETLKLLMQFMHHHRLPNLADHSGNLFKKPTQLIALAEAAEKYLVYSAMGMCNIRIASAARNHPLECFAYAVKFDYLDIADEAAPSTLTSDAEEVMRVLGPSNSGAILAWVRYREKYLKVAEETIKNPSQARYRGHRCEDPTGHWVRFSKAVLGELPQSPLDLISRLNRGVMHCSLHYVVQRHIHILDSCPRGVCKEAAQAWVDQCTEQLRSIGEFTTFLNDE